MLSPFDVFLSTLANLFHFVLPSIAFVSFFSFLPPSSCSSFLFDPSFPSFSFSPFCFPVSYFLFLLFPSSTTQPLPLLPIPLKQPPLFQLCLTCFGDLVPRLGIVISFSFLFFYLIFHSLDSPLKKKLILESQTTFSVSTNNQPSNHSKPTTTLNTSGLSLLVHATRNLGKTKNGEKMKSTVRLVVVPFGLWVVGEPYDKLHTLFFYFIEVYVASVYHLLSFTFLCLPLDLVTF